MKRLQSINDGAALSKDKGMGKQLPNYYQVA
jgi:hypothetical protein